MKNVIKKVFVLLLAATFYGCQTTPFYVNQAMKAKQRGWSGKIPNLEPVWVGKGEGLIKFDEGSSFVRINTPFANKFYREVETNLIDTTQEKQGYLMMMPLFSEVTARCQRERPKRLILPKPCKAFTELEVRILDNKGSLVKKYSVEKEVFSKNIQNFQKTCSDLFNCREKIQWASYENALVDILKQIHNDSAFLQKKLSQQSAN